MSLARKKPTKSKMLCNLAQQTYPRKAKLFFFYTGALSPSVVYLEG